MVKKRCCTCGYMKTVDCFSKRTYKTGTVGHQSVCKLCNAAAHKLHYKNNKSKYIENHKKREDINRQFIIDYLKLHPCVDCGEDDIIVLEFDHIDPSTKTDNIANSVGNGWAIERIQKEINKCEVVCANCHRRRTAKQFNTYRYKAR